jgi:hypothetical protein
VTLCSLTCSPAFQRKICKDSNTAPDHPTGQQVETTRAQAHNTSMGTQPLISDMLGQVLKKTECCVPCYHQLVTAVTFKKSGTLQLLP